MAENKDKYNLYTEKIKEKPWNKHKTLFRIMKLAGASAFAGLIAGLVFLVVLWAGATDKEPQDDLRHEVTFAKGMDDKIIILPKSQICFILHTHKYTDTYG